MVFFIYNKSMSFALEIKEEVLSQEFAIEQANAFISGLIATSAERHGSKLYIKMNNANISSSISQMMQQLNLKVSSINKNKNWIVLSDYKPFVDIKLPSYYFAGAFVGGGSISDTESNSYHLELQLYSHAEADKLQNYLNKYSFKFNSIQRRKLFVLYLKKSEQISDFLRSIQAFNSLMKFEDSRITRDFHNQLNRYSNLDTYNQQKLAKSTSSFLRLYKVVLKNNLSSHFREKELIFFNLKYENQYSSLEELSKIYFEKTNVKKTRAGLNHWIIKLRKVVTDFQKNQ